MMRELEYNQGYTCAKVLILLPTHDVCYTFLRRMLDLLRLLSHGNSKPGGDITGVYSWERFDTEYGPPNWDKARKYLHTTDVNTKDEQRRKKV